MIYLNKKGFALIETIIVMSILAIGLISLYGSFALIVRKSQNANSDSATNTYMAYQISKFTNDKNYESSNSLTTTYYIEILLQNNSYFKKECGFMFNEKKCISKGVISDEEILLYRNLNIDKIYFFLVPIKNVYNDLLELFDGSTINYLNKIKNDINISFTAEKSIIVKTKTNDSIEFSYYQYEPYDAKRHIIKAILGENNENVASYSTRPGSKKSSQDEAVLATTIDDYGLSYYYRGNVQNNYLVFADKCWRIVRITGDGNVKLVLYNDNSGGNCNTNDNSSAFARYNSSNAYTVKFNESALGNTDIGFMTGSYNSNNYNDTHENSRDSEVLLSLKSWYARSFLDEEKNIIVDSIWCNDKSIVSDKSYNGANNSGVKNYKTYYASEERFLPIADSKPSLICGGNSNIISMFTGTSTNVGNNKLGLYKLGLLTADEVLLAGGSINEANTYYYLNENARSYYWTMTPSRFDSSAYIWAVNANGKLERIAANKNNIALRPSIVISSNIFVKGDGSKNSPYVVLY